MNSAGDVVLTGGNTYTGGTTVNSGVLGVLGSQATLGTGTIYLNGGILAGGDATLDNPIEVDADSGIYTLDNFVVNGNITSDPSNPVTISSINILGYGYDAGVLQLHGDNSGFYGKFDEGLWQNYEGTGAMSTYFTNQRAGSTNAEWDIEGGALLANAVSGSPTIALGSLAGWGTLGNVANASAVTYQVGGDSQPFDNNEFDGVIEDGTDGGSSFGPDVASRDGTPTMASGSRSLWDKMAQALDDIKLNSPTGGNSQSSELNGVTADSDTDSTDDSGTVALTTTGTLMLTGQNTYSGDTTVEGGTLQLGDGGASGVLGSGNVIDNATLLFNHSDDITVSNAISGTGSIVQQGAGTLCLTGDNSYGGATSNTIINNGLFVVTSSTSLGAGNSGLLVAGSGMVDLNGFDVTVSALTLANGVIESSSGNPSLTASSYAVMSGTISVNLAGVGSTLTKSTAYSVGLSGQNTYSGLTNVQSGELQINNASPTTNVLTDAGGVNVTGGLLVLDYSASGTSVASTVQGLLKAAYNNGTNSFQTGQLYDTAATNSVGLGWVDNATTHQVTITPALYGDATLDGVVGPDDLSKLLTNYGKSGMTWSQGDFTYDGIVGPADLSKLLTNYGVQAQSGPPSVLEIDRLGADPTNANSVQFVVAFSEGVTGVDISDFHLAGSAGVSATIDSLDSYGPTGEQAVFVVTVDNVFGTGTLGLNFADPGTTIFDSDGNALTGPGAGGTSFVGQSYTLVNAGAYQPPSGTGILPDWLNVVQQTDPNELLHALTGSICPNGQGDGIQVTSDTLKGQADEDQGTVVASTAVFVNNLNPGENAYSDLAPYGIVFSTGKATDYGSGENTIPDTQGPNYGDSYAYGVAASTDQSDDQEAILEGISPIPKGDKYFDVTELDLAFQVSPGCNSVAFQVVFGTEEYAYWINQYPDAFGILLNGKNVAFVASQNINVNNTCMADVRGTQLNGVLDYGGSIVVPFTVGNLNPGANNLTFIIGDSRDPMVDSTVYIANLRGTFDASLDEGMASLAAEPAAGNLILQAPPDEPAQVPSFGADSTANSLLEGRRALSDASASAAQVTSVAIGSLLSPPAGLGNGENTDTVGIQLSPITASISTTDGSAPEPFLTTGTNGLTDHGLNAVAVDSLLSNGLDNLGGAQTLGTLATAQIREDAQA